MRACVCLYQNQILSPHPSRLVFVHLASEASRKKLSQRKHDQHEAQVETPSNLTNRCSYIPNPVGILVLPVHCALIICLLSLLVFICFLLLWSCHTDKQPHFLYQISHWHPRQKYHLHFLEVPPPLPHHPLRQDHCHHRHRRRRHLRHHHRHRQPHLHH